jgi:hypothetical protein
MKPGRSQTIYNIIQEMEDEEKVRKILGRSIVNNKSYFENISIRPGISRAVFRLEKYKRKFLVFKYE